ncbi:MAG TPA: hypothetical protein VK021_13550 [Flavobacteriaceae bacterium]|nr:hypothetical protein [Flavobacteriaceae bacterium]
MTKINPALPVRFRLIKIRRDQFATFKESYKKDHDFEIKYSGDIRISAKNHVVGVFTNFIFEQNGLPIMKYANSCHFEIHKDDWGLQVKDQNFILSKELGTHLLVLTVGTARGMIHRDKPRWLGNILLPILDVSRLIEEDLIYNISDEEE